MTTTWKSVKYDANKVVAQYVNVYSDGTLKVCDVDARRKTIREWYVHLNNVPPSWKAIINPDLGLSIYDQQQVNPIWLG